MAERNSDLNTHRTLLQDYNSALDNFVSWLANQESSADILLEEIKQNDPMRSSTWAARSKVSRNAYVIALETTQLGNSYTSL